MSNTSADVLFCITHRIQASNNRADKFHNAKIEYTEVKSELLECFYPFKDCVPHISVDAFSRFLLADLHPTVDKVIYTDVDIVFNIDIKELFDNRFKSKECYAYTHKYALFKYIPLMKVKRRMQYDVITDRYLLFYFILILKKVETPHTKTWFIFPGIPILERREMKQGSKSMFRKLLNLIRSNKNC